MARETVPMWFNRHNSLVALAFLLASITWITLSPPISAKALDLTDGVTGTIDSWAYPVASTNVLRDFWSPNGDYSAGHRGIDFAAAEGEPVLAVAGGSVRFAGQVGGRGVVSLTLADGYVAEVEPVCPLVGAGDQLATGQQVGTICGEGSSHCHDSLNNEESCVHLSARRFSADYSRGFAYVSPLLFLGAFKPSHLAAIDSLN